MLRPEIKDYLDKLDCSSDFFSVHTVAGKIREIIQKEDECSIEDNAEIFAFNVYTDEDRNTSWDSYFGPLFSSADASGNPVDFPSLKLISIETLDYWQVRFDETKHPVLKSLYGDLLIEFSHITKRRIDITLVHETIQSRINLALAEVTECLQAKQNLHRAQYLSKKFKRVDFLDKIFGYAITLEDKIAEDDKPGLWGFVLDWFLLDESFNAPEDKERVYINNYYQRHLRLIDSQSIWSLENTTIGLCSYYKKKKDFAFVDKVLKQFEDCIRNYSEFTESSLGTLHYLQNIENIYLQFNVSAETNISLHRVQNELKSFRLDKDDPNFKSISVTSTISPEQIKEFVDNIFEDKTLSEISVKMAVNFFIRKERERNNLKINNQKYVFARLAEQSVFDDEDKLLAILPPYEDGSDIHLIRHCTDNLAFSALFLEIVCKELRVRFSSDDLLNFMNETGLYNGADLIILKRILESFWEKDSLVCVHIGIPFIESTIRKLLVISGIAVTKKNKYGGYDYLTLSSLLNSKLTRQVFKQVFNDAGEDLLFTLKILLTEKLGLNLRNKVAHGIYQSDFIKDKHANNILLILMIISIIRIKN